MIIKVASTQPDAEGMKYQSRPSQGRDVGLFAKYNVETVLPDCYRLNEGIHHKTHYIQLLKK